MAAVLRLGQPAVAHRSLPEYSPSTPEERLKQSGSEYQTFFLRFSFCKLIAQMVKSSLQLNIFL